MTDLDALERLRKRLCIPRDDVDALAVGWHAGVEWALRWSERAMLRIDGQGATGLHYAMREYRRKRRVAKRTAPKGERDA